MLVNIMTLGKNFGFFVLLILLSFQVSCSTSATSFFNGDSKEKMIVSVRDQKMLLFKNGTPLKSYKVSTSKFGVGDKPGSHCTPLGCMKVVEKIGGKAPIGAVFKSRRKTGEVVAPGAPGRDPVVTRILWLRGTQAENKHAFRRTIYIHGTPEESRLGTPASYGCIRMGSSDVADLYDRIGEGAEVYVIQGSLKSKDMALVSDGAVTRVRASLHPHG